MIDLQIVLVTADLAFIAGRMNDCVALFFRKHSAPRLARLHLPFTKRIRSDGTPVRVFNFDGLERKPQFANITGSARRMLVSSLIDFFCCNDAFFDYALQNKSRTFVRYCCDSFEKRFWDGGRLSH